MVRHIIVQSKKILKKQKKAWKIGKKRRDLRLYSRWQLYKITKMKRIRFNKLNDWKNGSIVTFSLICFILQGYFNVGGTQWNTMLGIFGSIGIVIFFARMSYGKYYVGWNKVRIRIRINSFFGKSFNFKDIKSTNLENGILTVTKKSGEIIELDLSEIENSDNELLNEIIIKNTVANNT